MNNCSKKRKSESEDEETKRQRCVDTESLSKVRGLRRWFTHSLEPQIASIRRRGCWIRLDVYSMYSLQP